MENYEAEESDSEYFEMLIKKETNFHSMITNTNNWFKSARFDTIKWILERMVHLKFQYSTAYLSLIYFDRFFSRRSTTSRDWIRMRIISMACLSLAAKMEEGKGVPLSKFYTGGYDLDRSNVIQKTELWVLRTLEWRMVCVTPFAYVHYFVTKFFKKIVHDHQQIIAKAMELILAVTSAINAVEQRPSIVAAAAVLAAHDHPFSKTGLEIKIKAVPSWGSLDKEQMFTCYRLMRYGRQSRYTTPRSVVSRFR